MDIFIIKNKKGFSLVEMLISISIFGLLVLAVLGIYLSFNNTQIRTTAAQQLLNDSQYAIELMTKEIRNSSIAIYDPFPLLCDSIISDSASGYFGQCIILEREGGQIFAFTSYDSDPIDTTNPVELLYVLLSCPTGYASCDPIDVNSGSVTALLADSLNNINLDNLLFTITPNADPFTTSGPNKQPKVTIKMTTSYVSGNQSENVNNTIQTTVSSRVYKR